jgi:hypothetical protein
MTVLHKTGLYTAFVAIIRIFNNHSLNKAALSLRKSSELLIGKYIILSMIEVKEALRATKK